MRIPPHSLRRGKELDREGEVVGVVRGFGDGIAVHREFDDGTRGVFVVEDCVTVVTTARVDEEIAVAVGGGPETTDLDGIPDPRFRVLGAHRIDDLVTEHHEQRGRHRTIDIEPVDHVAGCEVLNGDGEPVSVGVDRADPDNVVDVVVGVVQIGVVVDVAGGLVTGHLAVIRVAVAVEVVIEVPGGFDAVAVVSHVVFGAVGGAIVFIFDVVAVATVVIGGTVIRGRAPGVSVSFLRAGLGGGTVGVGVGVETVAGAEAEAEAENENHVKGTHVCISDRVSVSGNSARETSQCLLSPELSLGPCNE